MPSGSKDDLLKVGNIVRDTWKVVKKLGEGGFGAVFEVVRKDPNNPREEKISAALKVESANEKNQVLKMEVAVLKRLQGRPHCCKYFTCGRNEKFNYVIMSLVGTNLGDLRKDRPGCKFSPSTSLLLTKQCMEAVSDIHEIGFLHRDIKPSNFAMGMKPVERTVIMLDFGLARQYITKGEMRPERSSVGFRGTVRYASITTHQGKDMARCDDLWSVVYMMVEFLVGRLPWKNLINRHDVCKSKTSTTPEALLRGVSSQYKSDLIDLINHVKALGYYDEPDYGMINGCLEAAMSRARASDDDKFDWEKGNRSLERKKSRTRQDDED